ncbi:hypothetical protein JZ751_003027 [Albula glossodonta]|uniref:Calponin-homology (CH) domain-containing protein n=1 Tax=Albula glossodonta TaxID=121402 RepID=A0A8T2N8K6_9TELE|nr:hypothetical protein JZ751_003027 [Albula glossodonta]
MFWMRKSDYDIACSLPGAVTHFANFHIFMCNPPMEVHDLFRDIRDGRILMALLEELSGCKLIKELTGNIKSQFPSTSSLSSLPTSSDSDTSHSSTPSDERRPSIAMRDHGKAIKTLLQWVQRRTRKYGVAVQDFGKSWTSGLAFLAVIKSIDSSLVDMRKALLRSSRENLEDAFRTAHYSLGIPRLLEPEDVTINAPDEQSIMTYVSQFLEHFPGFDEEEVSNAIERGMSSAKVSSRMNDMPVNGVHRKREKPFVVRKDWVQPPPKIFISSVSDDAEQPSPSPLQSPGDGTGEESSESISSSADRPPKRPQDLGEEVSFTVSSSSSPQPSFVDSVIDSPDSWSEMTSEAVPLEMLPESQSDSSLNESQLPFDYKDIGSSERPLGKPSSEKQDSTTDMEKATQDQVFSDLFIDEGNFSQSSAESFQTKSKIPSEEEDAYRYILDLNEEEKPEPPLQGNCEKPEETADSRCSGSEQMEQASVEQEKEEQTNIVHEADQHTSLSQTIVKESSPEHFKEAEKNGTLDNVEDNVEQAVEVKCTSLLQNHDGKQSSPELAQEGQKAEILIDTHCKSEGVVQKQGSDGPVKEERIRQLPPVICVELHPTIPSNPEEQGCTEIPQDSVHSDILEAAEEEIQNPSEVRESSGPEESQTNGAPHKTLDYMCEPDRTPMGSDQSVDMTVSIHDTVSPEDINVSTLESVKPSENCEMSICTPCNVTLTDDNTGVPNICSEGKKGMSSNHTSGEKKDSEPDVDENWKTDSMPPSSLDGPEAMALVSLDLENDPLCDIITPEVIATSEDASPKTPADDGNTSYTHPSDLQSSPVDTQPEETIEHNSEDHAYLSWMEGPVSGDGINDGTEEDDQKSSSTEAKSRPTVLCSSDNVSELKPAAVEERAFESEAGSGECLAENSEDSRQDKDRQEGAFRSQMPHLDELHREDARDSGGTELDMPSELCELIKTDEDPAVASENTESLRVQEHNEVSTNERQFSTALHLRQVKDPDELKVLCVKDTTKTVYVKNNPVPVCD